MTDSASHILQLGSIFQRRRNKRRSHRVRLPLAETNLLLIGIHVKPRHNRLCWLSGGGQSPTLRACVSPETWARSLWLSNAVYQPASPHVFELTNRVTTLFTPVGNEAERVGPT